ncbi:MAG: hypothetical protein ABIH99_05290, partial [Candidatus Micrarchaeota archaeon]
TSGIQDKKVVEAIGKGLEIAESTKKFEQTLRYEDINPPIDYLNAIKRCEDLDIEKVELLNATADSALGARAIKMLLLLDEIDKKAIATMNEIASPSTTETSIREQLIRNCAPLLIKIGGLELLEQVYEDVVRNEFLTKDLKSSILQHTEIFENKGKLKVLEEILREKEHELIPEFLKMQPAVEDILNGDYEVKLSEVRERLGMYARGLCGKAGVEVFSTEILKREYGEEMGPCTDGKGIYLPEKVNELPSRHENFTIYKVYTTHEAAHIEFGTFEMDLSKVKIDLKEAKKNLEENIATNKNRDDDSLVSLEEIVALIQSLEGGAPERNRENVEQNAGFIFLNSFKYPKLADMVFQIVENGRIDFQVMKNYPGIRGDTFLLRKRTLEKTPAPKDCSLTSILIALDALIHLNQVPGEHVRKDLLGIAEPLARGAKLAQRSDARVEDSANIAIWIYNQLEEYADKLPKPKEGLEKVWKEKNASNIIYIPGILVSEIKSAQKGGQTCVTVDSRGRLTASQASEDDLTFASIVMNTKLGDGKKGAGIEVVGRGAGTQGGGEKKDEKTNGKNEKQGQKKEKEGFFKRAARFIRGEEKSEGEKKTAEEAGEKGNGEKSAGKESGKNNEKEGEEKTGKSKGGATTAEGSGGSAGGAGASHKGEEKTAEKEGKKEGKKPPESELMKKLRKRLKEGKKKGEEESPAEMRGNNFVLAGVYSVGNEDEKLEVKEFKPISKTPVRAKNHVLVSKVVSIFEQFKEEKYKNRGRVEDGDDIDLDAVIEWKTDRKAGASPENPKLYINRELKMRDVSSIFLVDASGSTHGNCIELELDALGVMSEAVDMLGDECAVYAFNSSQSNADIYVLKDY